MQSLLQQLTEQWYAWVFLWGRFRKPSLGAGRGFTISLMPASNECPCVSEFGRLRAWLNSVFCYSDVALRLVCNSLTLVLICSELVWGDRLTCAGLNVVQHPVTASTSSVFFPPSQGCYVVHASSCQWWTTVGPALILAGVHEAAFLLTETSSAECWVLLSLIVSKTHLCFSAAHTTDSHLDFAWINKPPLQK